MKHTNQRGIYLRHPSLSRLKKKKEKETRWAPKLLFLSSVSVREDFLEAELTKPCASTPRQEGVRYSFICLFFHSFPACLQKGFKVGHNKHTYILRHVFKNSKGTLEILGWRWERCAFEHLTPTNLPWVLSLNTVLDPVGVKEKIHPSSPVRNL